MTKGCQLREDDVIDSAMVWQTAERGKHANNVGRGENPKNNAAA